MGKEVNTWFSHLTRHVFQTKTSIVHTPQVLADRKATWYYSYTVRLFVLFTVREPAEVWRSSQSSGLKNYKILSGTSSSCCTRFNANAWRSSIEQEWSAPWWSLRPKKSTVQFSYQNENCPCGSSSHTLCYRRWHQIGLFRKLEGQRWTKATFQVSDL